MKKSEIMKFKKKARRNRRTRGKRFDETSVMVRESLGYEALERALFGKEAW